MWLKIVRKQKPVIDPTLDPVLLVPGVAGSVLHAVDDSGHGERVWVRFLAADYKLHTKLWSRFDPSTGKTVSLDPDTNIVVPEDRYGLYAIDVLHPDMIFGREFVSYYHDLILEMLKWGFEEGKTLFGFGYDFCQSNRFQETLYCSVSHSLVVPHLKPRSIFSPPPPPPSLISITASPPLCFKILHSSSTVATTPPLITTVPAPTPKPLKSLPFTSSFPTFPQLPPR